MGVEFEFECGSLGHQKSCMQFLSFGAHHFIGWKAKVVRFFIVLHGFKVFFGIPLISSVGRALSLVLVCRISESNAHGGCSYGSRVIAGP